MEKRTRKERRIKAQCGVEGYQSATRTTYYLAAHARWAHTTPQRASQSTGVNAASTVSYEVDRKGGVRQCQGRAMGLYYV